MPSQNQRDAATARRAEVARLYCRGRNQYQIADRLGVTQATVSRDLSAVRAEWRRVMVEDFDRLKAEQLAKIDALELEAIRGWRRSLRDAEKKNAKVVTDPKGTRQESTTSKEGQAGDPRFLEVIRNCIADRCKLIGAYPADGDKAGGRTEVVIKILGAGVSMADLHGGAILDARSATPSAN